MFFAKLFGDKRDKGIVTDDRIAAALRPPAPSLLDSAPVMTGAAAALPSAASALPSPAPMLQSSAADADWPSQDKSWVKASDKTSDDDALIVLEAASDLGDDTAVEACRRVIEAGEKGLEPELSDLQLVQNYFR
jgi:hypothetical protein